MNSSRKIISLQKALKLRKKLSKSGLKAVFTNGCFDILHSGHVLILEKSRNSGDFLFVGLNSDASVQRLKGPSRPVNGQKDRARVLASLEAVGAVVIFREDTPLNLIRALRPDILVKGADYSHSEIIGREYAAKTLRIPLLKGRSTTATIRKMSPAR